MNFNIVTLMKVDRSHSKFRTEKKINRSEKKFLEIEFLKD